MWWRKTGGRTARGDGNRPSFHVSGSGDAHSSHGSLSNTGILILNIKKLVLRQRGGPGTVGGRPAWPADWRKGKRRRARARTMARTVERDWVGPQLENALTRLPRLIDLPMTVAVRHDRPAALPEGTSPLDVFRRCDQQMLIVGEPGAGKSVLMLRVMRELLEADDASVPIPFPVVLPPDLPAPTDLVEWLAWRVPPLFGGTIDEAVDLMRLGAVVPCLEGLDFVADAHLAGWAAAIRRYPELPMIVAIREATAETSRLGSSLTGTVRLHDLSTTALNQAIVALGDRGRPIRDLLADNPSVREWCTTPLMLSVVATANLSGDWDGPSLDEVVDFTTASEDPRLLSGILQPSPLARQHIREQYVVLRTYVLDLLDMSSPAVPRDPAAAEPAMSTPVLARGLRGLARAMRTGRQEYFDSVTLLAASDPAEARRTGTRIHAPRSQQELLVMLGVAGVVLSVKSWPVVPHALLGFGLTILLLWYSRVYGGLFEAPALRWAGRWTHALAGEWRVPLEMTALTCAVTLAYAAMAKVPFGRAVAAAGVMSLALLAVGLGAGLVKFRVRGVAAEPARDLSRVLVRGLAAGAVIGPGYAAAAVWSAHLAGTGGIPAGAWADDLALGCFSVFLVAGGSALFRHVVDRVRLVVEYRVPWQLPVFLSTAVERGFLVATSNGYRFTHTTVRAAVEVGLEHRPADEPASSSRSGPWSSGLDAPEVIYASVLDEVMARRDIRRRTAAHRGLEEEQLRASLMVVRASVLTEVSRLESTYRDVLAEARAADDADPHLRSSLPAGLVWLLLGTSPLWELVFPLGPRSLLDTAVGIGSTLLLLIVPFWALSRRDDDKGCAGALAAGIAYLVLAMIFSVFALTAVVNHFFGPPPPDEIGGWRAFVAGAGAFLLPVVTACTGRVIGRAVDHLLLGRHATWTDAHAAYGAWRTALGDRVLVRADVHLGPAEN